MSVNLPVPKDTRGFFEKIYKCPTGKSTNLGLFFNKFIDVWSEKWELEDEKKKFFYNEISNKIVPGLKRSSDYLHACLSRHRAIFQGMKNSGWFVEHFLKKADSRLIIGLGGSSVLETGLTLHPLYGFPYLPGSGLKGLARAYADRLRETSPDEASHKTDMISIFGSLDKNPNDMINNRQGTVVFLDGLPSDFPDLVVDIMNPHYGEYYQGDQPPADYLSPIPIFFLAIKEMTEFQFTLLSKDERHLKAASSWLKNGLSELGAGGKTNVGYGYFESGELNTSGKDAGLISSSAEAPSIVSIIENLIKKVKQCQTPGDKSKLESIFKEIEASELPREERLEFIKRVKDTLPESMKKNAKIKEFLKGKEEEWKG